MKILVIRQVERAILRKIVYREEKEAHSVKEGERPELLSELPHPGHTLLCMVMNLIRTFELNFTILLYY